MDKKYKHQQVEAEIYRMWEESGYFNPDNLPDAGTREPYTIVLPPPNASGKMHIGNVLMIAIEDLLIRWKRMQGYAALWVPGTDHAGFETQITFERELEEKGQSRFDFDRDTLYRKIWDFVQENKHLIENQIREMGASVDWSRYKFTLDDSSIKTVVNTFNKLHEDGLVYRDDYLVNFCPVCGTTFADLEIKHQEQSDHLYYIKYPIKNTDKYIVVATVRPETMFGDTAVAVNPKDKRYKDIVGKSVLLPLADREIPIIIDDIVDMDFGTGAVKITPAHDPNDFEVAKRHDLQSISVVGLDGNMQLPADVNFKDIEGMKAKTARKRTVAELKKKDLIDKIDTEYTHTVSVCYKGGHDIEPTILPNWFIKVDPLKTPAHEAVKRGDVKIFPQWQEVKYHRWMEEMHDWPISRQVVWGIRIPALYNVKENPDLQITFLTQEGVNVSGKIGDLLDNYSYAEIASGLQTLIAPKNAVYTISPEKPDGDYLQETDTFDTWFSSGQWPLITLGYEKKSKVPTRHASQGGAGGKSQKSNVSDFERFYPTNVLETGWEILRLWVSRMVMFGLYLTGKPPFHHVYLHGIVRAIDGRKMSKSLGNVIDPAEYQENYGTDALRMGLIAGTATGQDFNFPHDKVIAYRNFANKIWNMARFMRIMFDKHEEKGDNVRRLEDLTPDVKRPLANEDKKILAKLHKTIKEVDSNLEQYKFAQAAEIIYHYVWDDLASDYLESIKNRKDTETALSVFRHTYINSIKLLHPFMPFVTEAIWSYIPGISGSSEKDLLIISPWPETN